jgi:hypothetical protein
MRAGGAHQAAAPDRLQPRLPANPHPSSLAGSVRQLTGHHAAALQHALDDAEGVVQGAVHLVQQVVVGAAQQHWRQGAARRRGRGWGLGSKGRAHGSRGPAARCAKGWSPLQQAPRSSPVTARVLRGPRIMSMSLSPTLSSTTSSAEPRLEASKLSLPSMSASVITMEAPVALATRLWRRRARSSSAADDGQHRHDQGHAREANLDRRAIQVRGGPPCCCSPAQQASAAAVRARPPHPPPPPTAGRPWARGGRRWPPPPQST